MDLSYTELELVNKLRSRVGDVVPAEKLEDDYFLVRWLRARDLDMEKAERMLRKSMEWRKKNDMDTILNSPPNVNRNYRFALAGYDAEGCPVLVLPLGLWNFHEITEKDINPTYRAFLWMLARLDEETETSTKKFGKSVTQVVLIADYQKLAYLRSLNNRHLLKVSLQIGALFEANFPERVKSCIIVNTARLFPLILKLMKPFLSAKTFNKFEIYGPQRKNWIKALERKVPMEILPPYYGGTRPGIDDYCSDDSGLWNGEPLPVNYYGINISDGENRKCSIVDLGFQIEDDSSADGDSWTSEKIEAGSQLDLQIVLSQEMCSSSQTVHWCIKSEGYDIGMKVAFRPDGDSQTKDIVDFGRIDAHLRPQHGSLVCKTPGVYFLVLDNTYSKRRSKIVYYNAYVTQTVSGDTE